MLKNVEQALITLYHKKITLIGMPTTPEGKELPSVTPEFDGLRALIPRKVELRQNFCEKLSSRSADRLFRMPWIFLYRSVAKLSSFEWYAAYYVLIFVRRSLPFCRFVSEYQECHRRVQ